MITNLCLVGYSLLVGGAISWASKKQTCISHFTMESEFISLAAVGKEVKWLRNMLLDIELWPQPIPAILIYCDNEATLGRAYNTMYNGKSKHIRRIHNTIRQLLSTGVISIDYVKLKDNIMDLLTKVK